VYISTADYLPSLLLRFQDTCLLLVLGQAHLNLARISRHWPAVLIYLFATHAAKCRVCLYFYLCASGRTPRTTWNGPRFHGWADLPPVEDEVDRHHPTALCYLGELPTCFLDGLNLSEASPDPRTVFHRGGSKPEVVVGGLFPVWRRRFLDGGWLPEVRPVGSHPRTHQGPHFVPLPPRWKTSGLT